MKINPRKPSHWLLLARQGFFTLIVIALRVLRGRRDNTVILYGHQLSGNLRALYLQWEHSGKDTLAMHFLSLDPQYSDELERAGVNVLRCSRLQDMLKLSLARVMIADHGLHLMKPFTVLSDLYFIDVWHGIPYKGFIAGDFRLQHRYKEVWVSSEKLRSIYIDKFGFDPDRVKAMGYARVDKLVESDPSESHFKKAWELEPNTKIILYAPTWQHDDSGRQLFPFGEKEDNFIRHLSEVCQAQGAALVIRSHLNTKIPVKKYPQVIYCSQRDYPDTEDLLLSSDVLICDWSSIAFDYLVLNRPTIFLDVPAPFEHGFTLGSEYRFGEIAKDLDSLQAILESCLRDPNRYLLDHARTHREVARIVYDDHTDGKVAKAQLERLEAVIAEMV